MRTPVFERKTPDHKGLALTGTLNVELEEEDIEISRSGPGLSMKIQAKDCAQGGVFQMEPGAVPAARPTSPTCLRRRPRRSRRS